MGQRACVNCLNRRPHGIRRRRTVFGCYELPHFTACAERLCCPCVPQAGPPLARILFKGLDGKLLVLHPRSMACDGKQTLANAWPIRGESAVSKRHCAAGRACLDSVSSKVSSRA